MYAIRSYYDKQVLIQVSYCFLKRFNGASEKFPTFSFGYLKIRMRNWLTTVWVFIHVVLLAQPSGFEYSKVPADTSAVYSARMAMVYTRMKYRTDWYYLKEGGMVTTGKYKDRIHIFDTLGQVSETIFLDRDGTKKSIALYTYYPNHLPAEINEYSPLGHQIGRVLYVITSYSIHYTKLYEESRRKVCR